MVPDVRRRLQRVGLEQGIMQPRLFAKLGLMFLTVYVGDVFMLGRDETLEAFVKFLKDRARWKIKEKGPFGTGARQGLLLEESVSSGKRLL